MNMGDRIGHQACAACKYQRRRCQPDCLLAQHFPATRRQDFLSVHKFFGVHNIVKILKSVEPNQRAFAAETIVMQAKARIDDPVNGCLGIARKLTTQIEDVNKEVERIQQEVAFFREQKKKKEQLLLQQKLLQELQFVATSSSSSTTPLLQQLGISFNNFQAPTLLDQLPNEGSYNTGEVKSLFNSGSSSTICPTSNPQIVQDQYDDIKPAILTPLPNINLENKAIMKPKDSVESSARTAETTVKGKGKEKI